MQNKSNKYLIILENLLNIDFEVNVDKKYEKLANVLTLILGDKSSLYVHNIKKNTFRSCFIRGMDKIQVDEFIRQEISILNSLVHRERDKFQLLNARVSKQIEYSYIPLYYQSYMIGIVMFEKIKKNLLDELNTYELQIIFCYISQIIHHIEQIKVNKDKQSKDSLTGMNNMISLQVKISALIESKDISDFVFIVLKVASLKEFNKKYGYLEGNIVLKKISQCINSFFKASTYRLYGPKMLIVVRGNYRDVHKNLVNMLREIKLYSKNHYKDDLKYKCSFIIGESLTSGELKLDTLLEIINSSIQKLNESKEEIHIHGQVDFSNNNDDDFLLELMKELDMIK